MSQTITFRLNGRPVKLDTDGERHLLWALRSDLGLTGPKFGCGITMCGACTVLVNGVATRSCQYPLSAVQDADVITIEGLADGDHLHPLQEAFAEHGGFQCGYCTSGMILEAYSLLKQHPHPTRDQIVSGLNRNLCRCGAHKRIVEAIEAAAERM
jgi:aerobic-type carbon monoxide dehydrogenase small subunit (CoxS/CutS family)